MVYGRNTINAEAAIPMTESTATPWTIPRRDSAGRIKVVSAAAPEDAVNKFQMDTALSGKQNADATLTALSSTIPTAYLPRPQPIHLLAELSQARPTR